MNDFEQDKGSLLIGFLLGWATAIASIAAIFGFYFVLASLPDHGGGLVRAFGGLISMLPVGSMVGLIVWFAVKGKTRSAVGVGIAIASMVALVVLLVAACFGLVANGNFFK